MVSISFYLYHWSFVPICKWRSRTNNFTCHKLVHKLVLLQRINITVETFFNNAFFWYKIKNVPTLWYICYGFIIISQDELRHIASSWGKLLKLFEIKFTIKMSFRLRSEFSCVSVVNFKNGSQCGFLKKHYFIHVLLNQVQ